jgi:signal transduction histidine kinase
MIAIIWGILLLLASWSANAAELAPVRVVGEAASFALAGHFSQLVGGDPAQSLDDVIRRGEFRPAERERLDGGVRWYRVRVARGAEMPREWILAFGEPDIDDVRIFVPRDGGGYSETQIGRRFPSKELPLAARRHVARITLPEGESVLYLRLASEHKIRFEDAALWRPDALMYVETREATLLGIRVGVLGLLVVGYGLFGLWVRDGAMLLYAVYVATILSRALTHTGLITVIVPQAGSQTNYLMGAIGLFGGVSAFVLMWGQILRLKVFMPTMHRIYLGMGLAMLLPLLLMNNPVFPVAARAAHSIMLAASVVSLTLAVLMIRRDPGNILLKFYLIAFLPVVSVGLTRVASFALPIVPLGLGRFLDTTANTAHIAILGLTLAYRLGRMQRDRARIREELAGKTREQERLRTFIDMVTHEFKTPLAVIDSTAQVLEFRNPAQQDTVERVAVIRRSVKRLTGLIDTCLAGERYETVEIKAERMSPAAVLREAAQRNRQPGHADLVVEVGEPDVTCEADANLLGIAVDALVDNARRYGPPGQAVEVATHSDGRSVSFIVRDRGPGVPAEDAGRIFEKFYRSSSTASIAGTGIGLHLVRTIAELHGGLVRYDARPDGGAIFTLTIPKRS